MSRRLYAHNRVRYWYAYDLEEICALFSGAGLHVQTVRAWIKGGLKTIDGGKPALVYGYDLIGFLKRHNAKGKCVLPFDQFYCLKCHDKRPAFRRQVIVKSQNRFLKASGHCRVCKTLMFKSYKIDDYQTLRHKFDLVDVLELYDCESPAVKTHIHAQTKAPATESAQWSLFDG
jgi:hypothetical protein